MHTIDIDTGGTFTDGYVAGPAGRATVKVDTTPHDLTLCFWNCVESGAKALGLATPDLLAATRVIRFSSTIATNAAVQLSGPKLGLIVTKGAEADLYGRSGNPLFAFLRSRLVGAIAEETAGDGSVIAAPSAEEVDAVARGLLEQGARTIVVSLRNAHINPANELAVRQALEVSYPRHYLGAVPMLLSHQVSRVPDDGLRTNTAVLNAYFHRSLVNMLYKAEDLTRRGRYRHPLMVVTADFGVSRVAKTKAINTYQSGPAACVRGADVLSQALGHDKVLAIDVGGTTSDVSFVARGKSIAARFRPINDVDVVQRIPEIISYGVGGGSKIRLKGSEVTVGPDSQGAVPGPAAFGLGGSIPTPTDIWLALGYLDPVAYLGGRKKLHVDRSRAVIEKDLATPLGLSLDAAALRGKEIVEEELARLLRGSGLVPDNAFGDVTLYSLGGGGGLLAVGLAVKLGAARVYFPADAAVFSAFGASTLDVAHGYEDILAPGASPDEVAALVARLGREALRDMRGEGFPPEAVTAELEATAFAGDSERGGVPAVAIGSIGEAALAASEIADFVAAPPGGTDYVVVRLVATCAMPRAALAAGGGRVGSAAEAIAAQRSIIAAEGRVDVPVYRFAALPIGASVAGPAIVENDHTSILVPAGRMLTIDELGGGVVELAP